MSAVRLISLKNGLFLFEDAAQAHGGVTNIGNVGNSSDAGAFSFYPTKNLGALGDGGAITTNEPELFEKMKSLRSYGVGESKTDHVSLGWNSRLDPIQAAVLSTLLPSLADSNRVRREISKTYLSALKGTSLVAVLSPNSKDNVFHHFVVRDLSRERGESRAFLAERGIETDVHYPYSFSEVPAIRSHFKKNGWACPNLPNSETLASEVISLPMGPWMSTNEVKLVADALAELGKSPK
jgi:dTDP-4-amino-4,6-dideoxygalactose transaminase